MKKEQKVVEKKEVKKANGAKKPNVFKRLWTKIKEVFSELKKVTWPSFGKILKQTGVVIAVVLVFLIAIGVMDFGLSELLKFVFDKAAA
ncbi:MAG: preprotein translocase subunit SecE [Clostridia bacterium]|nr:preprotein translocase subunit SecE [Clostridia bacterium]MBR2969419.1 preprotein translocase subunit SecE [Clostridia bacterium]